MAVDLHESTTTALKRKGSRWSAVLLTPGQGSSANYVEEVLARDAATAFPPGTKHWFKHPDEPGQQRDPRDQWGVLEDGAHYEEGVGIVGDITVLPHWKEVVESLAEYGQASLSIWSQGEVDEDGNITALLPSRTNSVDMVDYPGRPGSKLNKLLESARAGSSTTPSVTSAQEKEGNVELEKEVAALKTAVESLNTTLTSFIAENKETADKVAAAEADAKAAKDGVEQAVEAYATASKAIDDADLLPSQADAIRAEAKKGVDVAPLIESAKKVVEEAKTVLGEKHDEDEGGYTLHESASGKVDSAAAAAEGAW